MCLFKDLRFLSGGQQVAMKDKPYIYLEHTADVKFQAFGKTVAEAFSNAILATFNLLVEPELVEGRTTYKITASAHDLEALLYDTISEAIFLFDAKDFVLAKVEEIKIDLSKEPTLEAALKGDKASSYNVRPVVKAVTYNEMFVKEEKEGWTIQVVLDA